MAAPRAMHAGANNDLTGSLYAEQLRWWICVLVLEVSLDKPWHCPGWEDGVWDGALPRLEAQHRFTVAEVPEPGDPSASHAGVGVALRVREMLGLGRTAHQVRYAMHPFARSPNCTMRVVRSRGDDIVGGSTHYQYLDGGRCTDTGAVSGTGTSGSVPATANITVVTVLLCHQDVAINPGIQPSDVSADPIEVRRPAADCVRLTTPAASPADFKLQPSAITVLPKN